MERPQFANYSLDMSGGSLASYPNTFNQVHIGGSTFLLLTDTKLAEFNFAWTELISIVTADIFTGMVISPNEKTAVLWNKYSSFEIISLASYSQISSFTPVPMPALAVLKEITFSQDSQYILVESNLENPIRIINVIDLTERTLPVNGTVS